jgi:hypothetical protein
MVMIQIAEGSMGAESSCFAGTTAEFRRVLCSLGANIEPMARGAVTPGLRRVMLGCPYERWTATIGPLPAVVEHFAPGGGVAFQTWEYRCDDGLIRCIGRKHGFGNGGQFISVRAVDFRVQQSFSESPEHFFLA